MANPDVIGMSVAGCTAFVMACVITAYLLLAFGWTTWFDHWMKQRRKVRMPKSYFKKKEEIKKILLNDSLGSKAPSEINDRALPIRSSDITNYQDTNIILQPAKKITTKPPPKKSSWVHRWNQRQPSLAKREYEEKDLTIVLGEEDPENSEFRIETELVDNEHLDVGPYKNDHSKEVPINGGIYNEPYLYSTVDSMSKKPSKKESGKYKSESPKSEMVELTDDPPLDSSVKISQFDETLIHL